MRDEHLAELGELLERGRGRRAPSRRSSGATARRAGSTTSTSTTRGATVSSWARLRESALFDRNDDRRDPARRARGHLRHPRLRRQAAACRTSTTCSSSARACRATRSRATASAATPTSSLGARHASKPLHLDIPITIAGMSFGALSAPAKEALGRGASAVGTSTTTGDGGMTPEEREHSTHARLPAAAVALRDEPRRPAPRRRDRDRGRPGRQAGRRRDAARPEDLRPRGRDARPAEGDRPAQRVPAPRLDRARTTSRSRSTSCARSPTGRSRSSSRSAPRGPTSTRPWR